MNRDRGVLLTHSSEDCSKPQRKRCWKKIWSYNFCFPCLSGAIQMEGLNNTVMTNDCILQSSFIPTPPVIIIGHRRQHLCCTTQGTVQICLGFTFCLSVCLVLCNAFLTALLLNKASMIVFLRTLHPLYSLTLIVVKRISLYKLLPFIPLMLNDNYRLWGGRGILARVRYVIFYAIFLAYSGRKADRTSGLSSFTAAPSISGDEWTHRWAPN